MSTRKKPIIASGQITFNLEEMKDKSSKNDYGKITQWRDV